MTTDSKASLHSPDNISEPISTNPLICCAAEINIEALSVKDQERLLQEKQREFGIHKDQFVDSDHDDQVAPQPHYWPFMLKNIRMSGWVIISLNIVSLVNP